jgi:hypothetical protein
MIQTPNNSLYFVDMAQLTINMCHHNSIFCLMNQNISLCFNRMNLNASNHCTNQIQQRSTQTYEQLHLSASAASHKNQSQHQHQHHEYSNHQALAANFVIQFSRRDYLCLLVILSNSSFVYILLRNKHTFYLYFDAFCAFVRQEKQRPSSNQCIIHPAPSTAL